MYEYNLVVLWPNGDYEGFTGCGTTRKSALESARRKARRKSIDLELFGWTEVNLAKYKLLPAEVKKQLKADWKMSARGEGEL